MKAKYINPFTDFGFKKIFGEEASKPLLLDFLNALLPQQNNIIGLSFKNTEQLGQTEKLFTTFIVRMRMEKNLLLNSKKQNKTILKKELSTIQHSRFWSKPKKASGTIT